MKEVIIIQPHSDDAILSCSKYLFALDNTQVTILTFENDSKRLAEDEKLLEYFPFLRFDILGIDYQDRTYKEFFKTYTRVIETHCLSFFEDKMGEEKMNAFQSKFNSYIKRRPKAKVITCLGIGHPFHFFVNFITKKRANLFYREFPHSYKRRNQNQFNDTMRQYKLKFEFDDKEANELKYQIASKVYRSQSGVFFYEQGYIKKLLPEQYYTKI